MYEKLLVIADMYQVDELVAICQGKLIQHMYHTNACHLAMFANKYSCHSLAYFAKTYILDHYETVKSTPGWTELTDAVKAAMEAADDLGDDKQEEDNSAEMSCDDQHESGDDSDDDDDGSEDL